MTTQREPNLVSLVCFEVFGLYDEFDYRIPINTETHVTAVIAPNGAGKTLCLKLIDALYKRNWSFFDGIEFVSVRYTFSDETEIVISREYFIAEDEDGPSDDSTLRIFMRKDIGSSESVLPLPRHTSLSRYTDFLPFLQRIAYSRWLDTRTNNLYTRNQLEDAFADDLPRGRRGQVSRTDMRAISEFLTPLHCTFIDTQRLIIIPNEPEQEDEEDFPRTESQNQTRFAIEQKSEKLRSIIRSELTKYAALSQSLDRTFPTRVLSSTMGPGQDIDIQQELTNLDTLRKQYMSVGILSGDDTPVEMPEEEYYDHAVKSVLGVYIEDNKKKLESLSDLYSKISLFKSLMTSRFGRKNIDIDKNEGFTVDYTGRSIPVEKLSSGEQHQLVLFFSLLFEIKPNSLILIDEPELSLHIAWQKKFIGDLIEIIKLRHFDVVLATHSPQLIGRWRKLVVELGDVYEGEKSSGFGYGEEV